MGASNKKMGDLLFSERAEEFLLSLRNHRMGIVSSCRMKGRDYKAVVLNRQRHRQACS
jgi:hypothetical protein